MDSLWGPNRSPLRDSESRISNVLIVAFMLRLFMVFFGSRILDASASNLNYTDIDYNIFTDAAQLVVAGNTIKVIPALSCV